MSPDTDVLIIGSGMSGVGLAIQLTRKYGNGAVSYEIYEKSDNIGGTWWANSYPGCGCDVASHFYSYSFALNPDWSQKFSLQPEIAEYFQAVAERYNVQRHIRFQSTVLKAEWDEKSATWLVTILDQKTNQTFERRTKILVSAVGALSVPKECEIPGVDTFKGELFHSAKWNHGFDFKDKEIVVLGNGCSATQFIPIISSGPAAAKKVTQFSRQAHWLAERPNPTYTPLEKWIFRYIPFAMRIYRANTYHTMESDFAGFALTPNGAKIRKTLTAEQTAYILKEAPEKYHSALIPKTEIGCKRKVMDTGYLASLHQENVLLVSTDPCASITPTGVLTKSGAFFPASAIILATGFSTQQLLSPLHIVGEEGTSLTEHWNTLSEGAAQAYYGTCVSGFPNFFMLMGPNTTTGHLSVIYSVECQINFILRVIAPLLPPKYPLLSSILSPKFHPFQTQNPPLSVSVTPAAELTDNIWLQSAARKQVWATGCTSWYVDAKTGRNTMMYPSLQWKFWLRSIFIPLRRDFRYTYLDNSGNRSGHAGGIVNGKEAMKMFALGIFIAGMIMGVRRGRGWYDSLLSGLCSLAGKWRN